MQTVGLRDVRSNSLLYTLFVPCYQLCCSPCAVPLVPTGVSSTADFVLIFCASFTTTKKIVERDRNDIFYHNNIQCANLVKLENARQSDCWLFTQKEKVHIVSTCMERQKRMAAGKKQAKRK